MNIRNMEKQDIQQICQIEQVSFSDPWSQSSFLQELENPLASYFVAAAEQIIMGYAGIWKIFDEGHITNIAVSPDFRNNGVGTILLTEMIKVCKEQGIQRFTLEVRRSNKHALQLYLKFGFQEVGVRKNYYGNEDALILWKTE